MAIGIEAADVASGLSLARAKDRPAIQAMGSASEIGSWQALFALSATALALGLVARDRRLAHAGRNMLTAGLVASLVKTTIKRTVHRTRPNVFMDEGHYARGRPGTGNGPWQSFPSGHAALSVAVAQSVARTYPNAAAPAYCAAAAIAAVQVVRGAHFPVDVLAGAVIGVAAEVVSHRPFTDEARRHG
nr:phosphatase PAP2 family protein [Methylorubrum extorquens]